MTRWIFAVALVLLVWPWTASAQGTSAYRVDAQRSSLEFGVRGPIGRIAATMRFAGGTIIIAPSGQILSAEIIVDATSLNAPGFVKGRLAGSKGLDVAKHPRMVFRATQVTQRGGEITIAGDLTMRGVTKPARFSGTIRGPNAGLLAINVSAEVDRTAWGITAGRPLYSRRANVGITLNARGGA